MTTVSKIYPSGELGIAGTINERIPAVTNGLIAHFPFDGRGGCFDGIGGFGTKQNVEQWVNLIDAMSLDWRNPTSWATSTGMTWDSEKQALRVQGYRNTWLKTPIVIDPNKKYFCSCEIMIESRPNGSGGEGYVYIGGYSTNAAYQRVTTNYDYSMASAYRPPLGQWVKVNLCRTGTGSIISRTSTSFNTTSGWTGDNVNYTDKLTKFWYFGGLWNYSCDSTAVMYIRNISVWTVDDDSSNGTITDDGLFLEEPTTNLWTGNFAIYNNFSVPAILTKLPEQYMGQPIYRLAMTPQTQAQVDDFKTSLANHGVYGSSITYLANTKYNTSIFWRCVNKSDILVGNTASNIGGWTQGPTTEFSNGWHRTEAYRDGSVATDKTGHVFYSFGSPSLILGETVYVDFTCPQIEQGYTFTSSYTKTSRSGISQVDIQKLNLSAPYTLSFEFTPRCPNNYNITNAVLSTDYTVNNDKLLIWKRSTEDYYRIRVTGSDTLLLNTDTAQNKKSRLTITVSATEARIYLDGILKGTVAQTTTTIDTFTLGVYQGITTSYNTYHSLSIYNRVLTAAEVSRLTYNKELANNTGNIINAVKEVSVGLPKDAYYWSLNNDCYDINHQFKASDSTGIIYDDQGAFVTIAIANEFTYPTFNTNNATGGWNHWGATGASGSYSQNTDRRFIYHKEKAYSHCISNASTATGDYLLYQEPACGDTDRAMQAIIKMSDGSPVTNSNIYPVWNARVGGTPNNAWTSIEKLTEDGWYLCKVEGIHQDGSNDLIGMYIKPGYTAYIDQVKCEQNKYCSPFITSTIGISHLEFNLNSLMNLQWNLDWSIVYWTKPVGTSAGLTGYSLSSLGCNSNSVGTNYVWWGKPSGSDGITGASPSAFDPLVFFNKWHMVSLVKSGTTVTIKEWDIGGITHIRTITGPTTANGYVTQYGYDLKLGGWDDTNACSSYFRDLIVVKRALSDSELNRLFGSKASINKDSLTVQYRIVGI